MKVHFQVILLETHLKTIAELENYETDLLPEIGDSIWVLSKQYKVVDRHWHIGNMIGMIQIFVSELHPRSI